MADVVVVAPLVKFEGDDWNDCRDFVRPLDLIATTPVDLDIECHCRQLLDNLNESTTSTSRDRLIDWSRSTTNRILCHCFGGSMAPRNDHRSASVRDTTLNNSISDNQIWNQLSEKYDNSISQELQMESVSASIDSENCFEKDHLSEYDDNTEAMEMSCLSIRGSMSEEPIKSADEVISEIVEMMEDDMEFEFEIFAASPSKPTQNLRTKLQNMRQSGGGLVTNLSQMPLDGLRALQEELDVAIRDYSEVLLCQLAIREELGFQKELFNQFISLLLSIQKKRRTLEVDRRKGKTLAELPAYRYLTTVIPYDDHQRVPDTDLLQIYIKILSAIDDDNSKVPALLTDYILNVLCPKS